MKKVIGGAGDCAEGQRLAVLEQYLATEPDCGGDVVAEQTALVAVGSFAVPPARLRVRAEAYALFDGLFQQALLRCLLGRPSAGRLPARRPRPAPLAWLRSRVFPGRVEDVVPWMR